MLSIQYFVEVYIKDKDDKPFELFQEKEIDIRQFIFTQEEIEEDLLVQKRILQLKNMIDPSNIGHFDHKKLDRQELLEQMPKGMGGSLFL